MESFRDRNVVITGAASGVGAALATQLDGKGANLMLLDVNGDEELDTTDVIYTLRYLFSEGAHPVRGTICVGIPGCPEVCGL